MKIDYKSFLKSDRGNMPQCADAMNVWLAEKNVRPISIETLSGASGLDDREVKTQELGLRVWFEVLPEEKGATKEVTREMLNASMKKAVEMGLVAKHLDSETYIERWSAMEECIRVALAAAP